MRASRIRPLAILAAALSGTGCYTAAHHSSPWEYGGGVRPAPGFALGSGQTTLHPMVGYTYLHFDGGHDEFFDLGGQIRYRPAAMSSVGTGAWIGGEAAFSRLRTTINVIDAKESVNGFSLTGMAGVPVGTSRWGPNVWAGFGIVHFTGVTGKNVRVGLDFQPTFLWKK